MGSRRDFGVGVVLFMLLVSVGAQQPECAAKLVPCANYINSTTTPPTSCCSPLRDAITNERDCLCNLYKNPSLFASLGINITQALNLPKLCGITGADLSNCNKSEQAPSPTSGGSPPGTSGNGSERGLAWIGMSGLAGLLLLWSSVMV